MDVFERLRNAGGHSLEEEPVEFAYLFGSHARSTADKHSDVDLAVLVEDLVPPEDFLDMALRLAGAVERASRVGPIESLVILNEASLPLAARVVHEGRVFFSRNEPLRVAYESRIFREFTDFDFLARSLDSETIRAHGEGRR
ncbi:MAG: type VII toxin-antitoxin system MntA family adenylyltransferase antitoxin [Acidimicrobiia bacterium]